MFSFGQVRDEIVAALVGRSAFGRAFNHQIDVGEVLMCLLIDHMAKDIGIGLLRDNPVAKQCQCQ